MIGPSEGPINEPTKLEIKSHESVINPQIRGFIIKGKKTTKSRDLVISAKDK